MVRVAEALKRYAPKDVEFVEDPSQADLQVLHVIGPDADELLRAPRYAVIQYCRTAMHVDGTNQPVEGNPYEGLWEAAEVTWSYYDLIGIAPRFYFAPLGVDDEFIKPYDEDVRDLGIMSSGFVSGPGAEAIEEVAMAGWMLEMDVVHLGPDVIDGMRVAPPHGWRALKNISDRVLAQYYRRCKWVSGLRHAEGFELPVIEGLMCGARPIVFDRPDMHQWYEDRVVFVPECSGPDLTQLLIEVMSHEPDPVTPLEREWVQEQFSWQRIVKGFWAQVLVHA
jgi:hypothetical protein